VRLLLAWLRLAAVFGMVGCSVLLTRAGCAGGERHLSAEAFPQLQTWWMERHQAKVDESKRRAGEVDLLFVGDSITQNYERSSSDPRLNFLPIWEEFFAPHGAMNLGFNGDRTSHVLWRLDAGEVEALRPSDVVLLIGTNNLNRTRMRLWDESPEQVGDGIVAVVEDLHRRLPGARVLVLAVLPSEFSERRTERTTAVNARVSRRVAGLSYARWLDLTGLFTDAHGLRKDLFYDSWVWRGAASLHPTAQGQRMMAKAVAEAIYGRAEGHGRAGGK
jgi:lysophospholipase L1-like esterase